jgi:hypothetical protein
MDEVLRTALLMREMGFAVHYLRPQTKIPVRAAWSDAPVMTALELNKAYRAGYNVGFRAGKWSVVGGYEIVVLDVDVKGGGKDADQAYAVVERLTGGHVDYTVRSGSGYGLHAYYRAPIGTAPAKSTTTVAQATSWVADGGRLRRDSAAAGYKPAWTIELLSTGKNVVAPPSVHPDTGNRYVWLEH